jgi:oxygen-independent coproporphyrinogen-3 oxidase
MRSAALSVDPLGRPAPKGGIYIHVPFCRRHCPFCDFAITTDLSGMEGWLSGLEAEMELRAADWDLAFDTLYFGGGTPSLLPVAAVGQLRERVGARFRLEAGAEVTLEANPGTLGPGEFQGLLERGVNRLSLGIQSFDDGDLRFLGRDHSVAESRETFDRARREGFENITVDLIYGLPGRTQDHWAAQIDSAAELGTDHISAYLLTYEPGTPLTRSRDRGEVAEIDEGEAQELFIFTAERLARAGYRQYEVSSFARSAGFRSRHNRKYWEGAPYLGLGPSAHSYRDSRRSWNTPRLKDYLEALARGEDPAAGSEVLGPGERKLERLALALRTTEGLDLGGFQAEFGLDLEARGFAVLGELRREGLLIQEGPLLRPTLRGLALADEIALRLAGI